MRTEDKPKTCYTCGEPITFSSNLRTKQYTSDGRIFLINTVQIKCSKGHVNPVGVVDE